MKGLRRIAPTILADAMSDPDAGTWEGLNDDQDRRSFHKADRRENVARDLPRFGRFGRRSTDRGFEAPVNFGGDEGMHDAEQGRVK